LIGGLAHRRLPERFFFLRGGAGGGPAGRPRDECPLEPRGSRSLVLRFSRSRSWSLSSAAACATAAMAVSGGRNGPRRLRTMACCTIVQQFVVIQYRSRPAGNLITK